MFGLFKRTKIEIWEIQLLKKALEKLPKEYSSLIDQINDGLLKGVLIHASDINGYIAFTYNSNVLKKYEIKNESGFKLGNIRVFDKKSLRFLILTIYVSSGTINGYALTGGKKYDLDLNNLDISSLKKEYNVNYDYKQILNILDVNERELINSSNIYSVYLGDKEFFNIRELEDGNFVGMDKENNIYKITHDPFETTIIERNKLIDILNGKLDLN
ncbi:hypothetical protein ACX0HA_15400 [Flavobacterium hauense]